MTTIINEDKFANKSAEEIIDEMLAQHKNDPREALTHLQDILKNDGLINKNTLANLQKAAKILTDKNLQEGWFSNKPTPKYPVKFEVYLPFKQTPAEFQIPPVATLNDPLVKDAIKKIRARHPKSTIYLRSELGDKRITESSYTIAFEGKEKYTCEVGTLPMAMTLAEQVGTKYNKATILYENRIVCTYNTTLKEWAIDDKASLTEDIYTNADVTDHSYVDLQKDIINLDERTKVILCKLNPSLIDIRKPKWYNTLTERGQIVKVGTDTRAEIFIVLKGIDGQIAKDPDQTEILITEKIPTNITTEGNFVYRDGESFVITVKQFKEIITDPKNAEILAKFEKSKGSAILSDEEAAFYLELDKQAKQNLDAKYPEWEETHYDMYKLDNYTLPERAKIYLAWKDANRTTSFQQAHELSAEEVDARFGLPKLKAELKKQQNGEKILAAFNSIYNSLGDKDKAGLNSNLSQILNKEKFDTKDITETIGYYGAKNQLDQLSKGKLTKTEKDLGEADKTRFETELSELIKNKYIDSKSGLPKIAQNISNAMIDITKLLSTFDTKTSEWNKNVASIKKVSDITTAIVEVIKEISKVNPNNAKELKDKFIGTKSIWQRQQITGEELIKNLSDFLQYSMKVKDDALERAEQIDNIANNHGLKPEDQQAEIDKIKSKAITKSDKELAHDKWLYDMQHILDQKKDEKIKDRSYYTAITNKISRLVKTDPTAAAGYSREFDKLLQELESKYPDATNPEVEVALEEFLTTMKKETHTPGTLAKKLDTLL